MTAQQQLVELNSRKWNNAGEGSDLNNDRARFLAEYGPALAELIEAAQKQVKNAPKNEPIRPESSNYDDIAEWAGKWDEWFSAGPLRVILAKLTEPK